MNDDTIEGLNFTDCNLIGLSFLFDARPIL